MAHYSSRQTVSQLKGVSYIISNWFENHQPQRTHISTITNAPFIPKLNLMASRFSRLTTSASLRNIFFHLLQYSRQRLSFSAHRAALITKTDLTFPAFSLRFVDFVDQTRPTKRLAIHLLVMTKKLYRWPRQYRNSFVGWLEFDS